MSLNNLCLPPQLLAELYGHTLVEGFAPSHKAPVVTPFEGGNEKAVLIVINEPKDSHLSKTDRAFLEKVLAGCQLTMNDVAVINSHDLKAEADDLYTQFSPKKILLLDVEAAMLSLPPAEYYVLSGAGNVEYLLAPSLATVQASQDEKRKLWTSLKQLFCL